MLFCKMKSKSFSDVILRNIVTKNLNTKAKFTDSSLILRMITHYNDSIPPKVTKNLWLKIMVFFRKIIIFALRINPK